MNNTASPDWLEHSQDRLSVGLFIALLLHLFIIFGLGFAMPQSSARLSSRMDVVLVQTKTESEPVKAKFLAQVNQDGGGDSQEVQRASSPTNADYPDPIPNITSAAVPQNIAAAPKPKKQTQLLAKKSKIKTHDPKPTKTPKPDPKTSGIDLQSTPNIPKISASSLILNAKQAVASLQAELDANLQSFKDKPPHKYISARTKAHAYASYMDSWRIKVERLGQRHFPQAARKQKLFGSVILDVAIRSDGTVIDVQIMEPASDSILNDAAVRIANLGSPYAIFTDQIKAELGENGILHIIRTWRFDSDGRFSNH